MMSLLFSQKQAERFQAVAAPKARPESASRSGRASRAAGRISARCRNSATWGSRPTSIVGASIGAVVGGCYAAGRLDELEDFALLADQTQRVQPDRRVVPRRRPDGRAAIRPHCR